jgi:uncharacterized integral membrane protein
MRRLQCRCILRAHWSPRLVAGLQIFFGMSLFYNTNKVNVASKKRSKLKSFIYYYLFVYLLYLLLLLFIIVNVIKFPASFLEAPKLALCVASFCPFRKMLTQ